MTALFQQGAQVGGARIVRVIGSGEVATVYEALHEGALRALKIIEIGVVEGGATKEGESTTAQARGALEGEAIAMIEHVNVVRWFDSGIDHGRVWIVLELVNGSNLHQLRIAAGGRLPVERTVSLMRQACEGLVAVHKKKIVHRDLKPENILVTCDDIAKVADFGNAKLPGWGVKTTTALRISAMAYMAPEVWRGDGDPDPRSDVYAMGLIIYEMITGTNPIVPHFLNMLETCKRHLQYEPPPLVSVVDKPEELSELSALLQRAMAKDLTLRCTMRELADGLESVQDRLLVWRRAAARSLPLPNQHPALALTAPMPAIPNPALESSTPAPAPAPVVSLRGTIVMQAAPSCAERRAASHRSRRGAASSPAAARSRGRTFNAANAFSLAACTARAHARARHDAPIDRDPGRGHRTPERTSNTTRGRPRRRSHDAGGGSLVDVVWSRTDAQGGARSGAADHLGKLAACRIDRQAAVEREQHAVTPSASLAALRATASVATVP